MQIRERMNDNDVTRMKTDYPLQTILTCESLLSIKTIKYKKDAINISLTL